MLVFFVTLSCTEAIALTVLALRKLPVIAVSATESRILTIVPPRPELLEAEVKRAVAGYVSAHYTWEWGKIDDAFREAAKYVSPEFTKAFLSANEVQVKVAREKKVSQQFYIAELSTDLKGKVARVSGDRILLVEGLRATNPLSLEVQFDYGPRTESNPEGVYVVGEKLLPGSEGGER